MSTHLNVRVSEIMCTPLILGIHTYMTYANCRTLPDKKHDSRMSSRDGIERGREGGMMDETWKKGVDNIGGLHKIGD